MFISACLHSLTNRKCPSLVQLEGPYGLEEGLLVPCRATEVSIIKYGYFGPKIEPI